MTQQLRSSLGLVLASLVFASCSTGADERAEDVDSARDAISADGRYIVKFKDWSKRGAAIAAGGGLVARELPELAASAMYLPDAAVKALANNPNVEYVEVDPRRCRVARQHVGARPVQPRLALGGAAQGSRDQRRIDRRDRLPTLSGGQPGVAGLHPEIGGSSGLLRGPCFPCGGFEGGGGFVPPILRGIGERGALLRERTSSGQMPGIGMGDGRDRIDLDLVGAVFGGSGGGGS